MSVAAVRHSRTRPPYATPADGEHRQNDEGQYANRRKDAGRDRALPTWAAESSLLKNKRGRRIRAEHSDRQRDEGKNEQLRRGTSQQLPAAPATHTPERQGFSLAAKRAARDHHGCEAGQQQGLDRHNQQRVLRALPVRGEAFEQSVQIGREQNRRALTAELRPSPAHFLLEPARVVGRKSWNVRMSHDHRAGSA